jgi:hypothetical protein
MRLKWSKYSLDLKQESKINNKVLEKFHLKILLKALVKENIFFLIDKTLMKKVVILLIALVL